MLVRTIVVHHPDFFGAGAGADEGYLGGGDAGIASREFKDNFVGELMGELADLGVGGFAAIDFADDGLGGGVVNVVEPCGDSDFGSSFGEVTEGDIVSFDAGIRPSGILEFGRLSERLCGHEARADELDDAGEGEIVADDLGELLCMRFGAVGAGAEVGNGDADFVRAETSGGVKPSLPLLCRHRSNLKTNNGQDKQSK